METDVLHVAGIADVVYSFLGPSDKKALSLTCKAMRRVYLQSYFPMGLIMTPMRLSVDSSWSKNGEGSLNRKCVCARKTSPLVNILGMKTQHKLGMLTHCGRIPCRDQVVRESYERAVAALVVDGGNAVYYSKTAYYSMMERCMTVPKTYAKVRITHDMLVAAMMKQVMCADKSECHTVDPRLVLECSITTIDKLTKSTNQITQNIFVGFCEQMDVAMEGVVTHKPSPPFNGLAPRSTTPSPLGMVPSTLFGHNPFAGAPTTTAQSDEPIPMVY